MGEKFRQIRDALELSQNGMVKRLGSPEGILGTSISGYERGIREPPLLIVLAYARVAAVPVEMLIDDARDLHSESPIKRPKKNLKTPAGTRSTNVT